MRKLSKKEEQQEEKRQTPGVVWRQGHAYKLNVQEQAELRKGPKNPVKPVKRRIR